MGILANSVSVSHLSSTEDDVKAGYLDQESITLTLSETGSTYLWSLASPVDSEQQGVIRGETTATAQFVPDVAGYYVVTCLLDGVSTFILRISVTSSVVETVREALRLQPKEDDQVAAPAVGLVVYCSSTQGNVLCVKDSSNVVYIVSVTAV